MKVRAIRPPTPRGSLTGLPGQYFTPAVSAQAFRTCHPKILELPCFAGRTAVPTRLARKPAAQLSILPQIPPSDSRIVELSSKADGGIATQPSITYSFVEREAKNQALGLALCNPQVKISAVGMEAWLRQIFDGLCGEAVLRSDRLAIPGA